MGAYSECKLRDDYDIGDTITIDDCIKVEKRNKHLPRFMYRWKYNDTIREQFQIFINAKWRDAQSIDFDFC